MANQDDAGTPPPGVPFALPSPTPADASGATPARGPAKTTAVNLLARKGTPERTVAVTAYDVAFARLADAAGIDIVLVGDSLGMVIQGHDSTLPVTLDEIVYHTRAVARGVGRAHLVADMPFMSYQASVDDGVRAAWTGSRKRMPSRDSPRLTPTGTGAVFLAHSSERCTIRACLK